MITRPIALGSLLIAATAVCLAMSERSRAQEPTKVLRVFTEIGGLDPDGNDLPYHDWTEDGSQILVGRRITKEVGTFEFASSDAWPIVCGLNDEITDDNGDLLLHLAGSRWAAMEVVHVSASGVEHLDHVRFLAATEALGEVLDPHAAGLLTETGPEGDATLLARIPLRYLGPGNSYAPDKWCLTQGYPDAIMYVSAGWFNK